MTRTSAIFGVVSVLTAAIVGGVFIRKKIIDDALYWRAFAEFEAERKRRIRSTEEEIKEISKNISENESKKNSTNKSIEKYKKDIKKLEEEIKQLEEKIEELKSPVNSEKIMKIYSNLKRRKALKTQIQEIKSKTEEIQNNNELKNKLENLENKFKSITEILKRKEKIINDYADYKINNHIQLKAQEKKKNEKLGNKKEILKELKSSESLFSSIELLIQEFKNKLNEKNNKLFSLRQQTFQGS